MGLGVHGGRRVRRSSPRPACGERSRASCERVRGTLDRLGLADSPPHPETSLRFVSDLSPQAGRGKAAASSANTASQSRRAFRASFAKNVPPAPRRGRRECRASDAPDSRVCNEVVKRTRVSQVTPESPGIPRAMVLTVSFALSSVTGFLATVIPEKLASQELDTSVGASGPHDFAVRRTRHSSLARSASTASPPQRS